jgi:hypothetical protein
MPALQKSGNAIYNDDIRKFIAQRIQDYFSDIRYQSMVDIPAYIQAFKNWITSSELNPVRGLESFAEASVSLGVTQAIDEFHYQSLLEGRSIRLFRGEYPYHRDIHPFDWESGFIDDHPLKTSDSVVISYPFSGTGEAHPKMQWLFDECQNLKIPLFLDLAWFGTCGGLTFDLQHPAITHASFSLSKGLTCGNYRSGVRFSRHLKTSKRGQDRLSLQQEWNHSIHLNLMIGKDLMENFSPDTQYKKYRKAQIEVCNELGLNPSPCVHIATGVGLEWEDFSRDGVVNRINIRELVKRKTPKITLGSDL